MRCSMFYERKTKDQSVWKVAIYPIGFLLTFFIVAATAGFEIAFYVLGTVFFLMSVIPFVTFARTSNAGFLAVGMFQVFAALVCVSAPHAIKDNKWSFSLLN